MTLLPHLHVKFESPTVMLQKAVERKGNVSFKQYEYEKRNYCCPVKLNRA